MGSSVWKRPCYVMWLFVAGLATMSVAPAIAHHGWSWAVDEQTTLQGTILEISMAPPHPSLRVVEDNGTVWQVDLANPNQTVRSGFTAQSAKQGDAVTVLGNRHRDETKKQMKAVRITIGGANYDMYPERIRAK